MKEVIKILAVELLLSIARDKIANFFEYLYRYENIFYFSSIILSFSIKNKVTSKSVHSIFVIKLLQSKVLTRQFSFDFFK
jgi:hypothetical protein